MAIDTPKRTYLDLVDVPASGAWTPQTHGLPLLAQWENQSQYSELRFQPFAPGDVLTPEQIMKLLPQAAPASHSISITDAPYRAQVAPADATAAIQAALDAAAQLASADNPVDVLVPPGTFQYSKALRVGADVRLRREPPADGGVLRATDVLQSAVHLIGDRSGALFLVLQSNATARDVGPPGATGVWVGSDTTAGAVTHDALVIGVEVAQPAGAHFFGLATEGSLWAFNYAHDGWADTFHHTGGSRFCQVVGNRARTRADRGDDFYAFVGYQDDGDVVHHCSCIANWGRDGHARGLSAVGAGFIVFARNDIEATQWAGVYLAQEDSFDSYGSFDIHVLGNRISRANLAGSHDGLLAYADSPAQSHASKSFGMLSNRVRRLTITGNTISDTAPGIGNGHGVEIRPSVDEGQLTGNTLRSNRAPQLLVQGTNFSERDNTSIP
ncbi:MAG TPA: right-handed parallel beta-helix repeat-containing protein [Polyangiales bacterium]|nr:right-handed parallel beta-helix repeat-containing protein [Polyangiales bacterium]